MVLAVSVVVGMGYAGFRVRVFMRVHFAIPVGMCVLV